MALSGPDSLHYRDLGVTQPSARWSSDFPPPDIIGERSPGLLGPIKVYYRGENKSNRGLSRAAVPFQETEDCFVCLILHFQKVAVPRSLKQHQLSVWNT